MTFMEPYCFGFVQTSSNLGGFVLSVILYSQVSLPLSLIRSGFCSGSTRSICRLVDDSSVLFVS